MINLVISVVQPFARFVSVAAVICLSATVLVAPGTYHGPIVVDSKLINLISLGGAGVTTISGTSAGFGAGALCAATHCWLGLSLHQPPSGVLCEAA